MGRLVPTETTEQAWCPKVYQANAGFVPTLGAGVMEWLSPRAGERILDLGCGDGTLTRDLMDVGAHVVGVDASESFVSSAAERGIDARVMDGCDLLFDTEFDAVFSNAAIHWMSDPPAVVSGVKRALKPGGRFVAEFGGHGNVAAIVTAMQAVAARFGVDPALAHPWYFPTPDEYSDLLSQHGFVVERIALIPRPTPLPTGLRGWIQTFREPLFAAAGRDRDEALSFAESLLERSLRDRAGRWTADYVRIRVEAHAVDHAT